MSKNKRIKALEEQVEKLQRIIQTERLLGAEDRKLVLSLEGTHDRALLNQWKEIKGLEEAQRLGLVGVHERIDRALDTDDIMVDSITTALERVIARVDALERPQQHSYEPGPNLPDDYGFDAADVTWDTVTAEDAEMVAFYAPSETWDGWSMRLEDSQVEYAVNGEIVKLEEVLERVAEAEKQIAFQREDFDRASSRFSTEVVGIHGIGQDLSDRIGKLEVQADTVTELADSVIRLQDVAWTAARRLTDLEEDLEEDLEGGDVPFARWVDELPKARGASTVGQASNDIAGPETKPMKSLDELYVSPARFKALEGRFVAIENRLADLVDKVLQDDQDQIAVNDAVSRRLNESHDEIGALQDRITAIEEEEPEAYYYYYPTPAYQPVYNPPCYGGGTGDPTPPLPNTWNASDTTELHSSIGHAPYPDDPNPPGSKPFPERKPPGQEDI